LRRSIGLGYGGKRPKGDERSEPDRGQLPVHFDPPLRRYPTSGWDGEAKPRRMNPE
jgi:hypothetical protein